MRCLQDAQGTECKEPSQAATASHHSRGDAQLTEDRSHEQEKTLLAER